MARSRMLFAVAVALSSSALMLGTVPTVHAADPPKCEPDKLAAKYPSLVGKKVIVGQDGESPPYSFRDPKDFNSIIGADADMPITCRTGFPVASNSASPLPGRSPSRHA